MQENINYSNPDDGFGDKLRNAFIKVQNNFTELYNSKVDKVAGKGLSENDFTDSDKSKLDGIEAGAQVNVNADFGENDPSAPGYILNRPPSMYASVGYFTYNDVSTISAPLVLVSGVAKKLTNDTLGIYTGLGEAPYGVSNIWKQYANQFDFSQLSIGDTLDMRVDALLTTTGTNKTYKILLKLGIGTPSEFTILVGSGELKNAVTDENIVKEISFYIGSEDIKNAPAELYLLLDSSGSVKVNGWYTRILRKGLNIIDINSDPLKLDKVSTVDVEKVYVKNADGTQSMKPTSELGGSSVQSVTGDSVDNTDPLNPIINAIPLSGTTDGNPVNGSIEMFETGKNIFVKNTDYEDGYNSLEISEGAIAIQCVNNDDSFLTSIAITQGVVNINTNVPESRGLTAVQDFTPNITDLDYTQKKYVDNLVNTATVTVELVNSLFTDFYAPYDLRINTTNTIFGVGTITLKVNDVAYTLTDLIIKGDKITVETNSESVFNLNIIYE